MKNPDFFDRGFLLWVKGVKTSEILEKFVYRAGWSPPLDCGSS
jgi:hypothetical protein